MLHGKEAESEAIVGGKPVVGVSLQECPTGQGSSEEKIKIELIPDNFYNSLENNLIIS